MRLNGTLGMGVIMCAGTMAAASGVGDIAGLINNPRLFNDFGSSTLTFNSAYSPFGSSVDLREENYGSGGFANRHAAWFSDGGTNKVDFNYGDAWDMQMTMQVNSASGVGNVEAGFQADLFGFGLFGVLTANGEIAAFGSVLPFHTFGTGLYNVGDEIMLRMIHTPGAGQFSATPSTMEYLYNNMTTGSGWVSSGAINFTTGEGGIPTNFDFFAGVGAQINAPGTAAVVDISFRDITTAVPSPASLGLLSLAGLAATRRRR
jgi:MYXO-CTERM domain-containing protein